MTAVDRGRTCRGTVLLACLLLVLLSGSFRKPVSPPATPPAIPENCRLFGMVTAEPEYFKDYRPSLDRFQYPTAPQDNGWSIGMYSEYGSGGLIGIPGKPMIIRSEAPIDLDHELYAMVLDLTLRIRPQVILGHLRTASSGCNYIADPHPFEREMRGEYYSMIHNGGVFGRGLEILRDVLVADFAQPENCPDSPIDSEYLMIYLHKVLNFSGNGIFESIQLWASMLRNAIGDDYSALNIVLTQGDSLWAVRCSRYEDSFLLHYQVSDHNRSFLVSTDRLAGDWAPLDNNIVAEFIPGRAPRIEQIPYISYLPEPVTSTMAQPVKMQN